MVRLQRTLTLLLALAPAAAAAPSCSNGLEPRLTGDLFTPAECSSDVVKAPELGVPPAAASAKTRLKELEGRWEGSAVIGFGRYEMLAELRTRWSGKGTATLKLKELQLRQRSGLSLALAPAKGGRYALELAADQVPGKTLAGEAVLGVAASSAAAAAAPRQADLTFANGAVYRVRWTPKGPDALDAHVWTAVPGAPPRDFEVALKRTARESL